MLKPLRVEIGNIPILIELDGPCVFEENTALYEPFITSKKCLYRIKVSSSLRRGELSAPEGVSLVFKNSIYKIECAEFKGILDLDGRRGSICLSAPCSSQALVSALTNFSIFLKLNKGGIVFHASAIVRENRAYVFFGPSGAGKSTVAELSQKYTVLSQELVGFDFLNRSCRAFAFPYYEDLRFSSRSNGCFKVAGLFKLVKDKRNYLKAIPKALALADFFTFPYDLGILKSFSGYFNQHSKLIESVSCYELHFLPDGSFWKCIDGRFN